MSDSAVLIDTSAWILFLRGNESAQEIITDLLREENAFTTELILFELLRGAKSKKEYRILFEDFRALPLASINKSTWHRAYGLGFELRKAGINVPTVDTLIACAAATNDLSLLHRDKHYSLIAAYLKLDLKEI